MPFETDHLLVPFGQDSGGDENAADVLHDLAFRELIQGLVGERAAAGAKIGQDGGHDAFGEPAHRGAGPFGAGQGVVEGLQLRGYGAGVVSEEIVEPLLESAARTRTRRVKPLGLSASGTWAPELGVRCRARTADGRVGGAGVDAAESSVDGAVSLPLETAAAARGPSAVRFCTRRRSPQLMQTSVFAGSVSVTARSSWSAVVMTGQHP